MAKDKNTEKTVRVRCYHCGGGFRNHRVLCERKKSCGGPDGDWDHDEYHQFIECMGCETIKYYRFSMGPDYNPETMRCEPYDIHVYPDDGLCKDRRTMMGFGGDVGDDFESPLVPENVWKMYRETLRALNANALTLAGGGLRATVEAICLEQGLGKGTLQAKIDELVTQGRLTATQAELLQEERYLGNAALHEMSTPSPQDLEDGLGIVEGLINTIYVLPVKAQRLRTRRESKGAKKTPHKKTVKKTGSS